MNQKGFVLISYLVTLPLLLSVVFGVCALVGNLMQLDKQVLTCQKSALTVSLAQQGELNALLKLNPKAKSLRFQRNVANMALLAAMATYNPAAIAKAKARVQQIKLRQRTFKSKQTALYKSAKLRLRLLTKNHRFGIRKQLKTQARVYAPKLDLIASPKSSDSPSLIPSRTFERTSTITTRWRKPVWGLKFLNINKPLSASCSLQLYKPTGSFEWKIKVAADKFS